MWYNLLNILSILLRCCSLKSTIILQKTKKGKRTGKIFVAQTDNPFKQDCEYFAGELAKIKQSNSNKKMIILFDFVFKFIYNYINSKGFICVNWRWF